MDRILSSLIKGKIGAQRAGPPRVGRLPLNTVEDFVYLQHVMRAEFRVFPISKGIL